MKIEKTKLLVIGGGPGGYVTAIRAAQLGIDTTLVEGEHLGGTCLNIGCIPSKAFIHAAEAFDEIRHHAGDSPLGIRVDLPSIDLAQTRRWKDGIVTKLTLGVATLLKKNGVKVVKGWASIIDGKTVDVKLLEGTSEPQRITCEHLVLAPGSETVALPDLPFGGPVISATEALSPPSLPANMVVVGGGYIGLELGTAFRKLGATVAVVETLDRILPGYDEELVKPVVASLRRLGVQLYLGCRALGLNAKGDALRIRDSNGQTVELKTDRVLVAVGRRPRTEGYNLESLHLDMNGNAIKIDDQCKTSMRDVWAIGDVTGEPMLAHRAMAQGEMVAEIIAGKRRHFTPAAIPAVCFTDPEIVTVGQILDATTKVDCLCAQFPFSANGRAMTVEATEGFVRVVARRDNHSIIGWQAVGRGVSELCTAFSHSIEFGARLEDVAGTIHAHPTLGEAVQEAAMRALGHALHV